MSDHKIDFNELVNRVADRFEETRKIAVEDQARLALITPAIPHQNSVEEALKNGEITVEFLEKCIIEVLNNAVEPDFDMKTSGFESSLENRRVIEISDKDIKSSLAINCPYVFWC